MTEYYKSQPGTVYIVGAGPGDPNLVTIKGIWCLKSSDVVLYDRLVNHKLLNYVSDTAEIIDVGKSKGNNSNLQSKINQLLVSKAKDKKRVVRLKSGDPFVFGRGGEELEYLAEHDIPYEIIPGVSSAIAVPAFAGIPLTHRAQSSSITIVTGAESSDKRSNKVDWAKYAQLDGTLVILMGFNNIEYITNDLVNGGMPDNTPVALIEKGTLAHQRTLVGKLSEISRLAINSDLESPILAVIGKVVDLRNKLKWFDNQPLFSKRVLITRSHHQSSNLSRLLEQAGAHAIEMPLIEIQEPDLYDELDFALMNLDQYDWVIFPSSNSVDSVFSYLKKSGKDSRVFRYNKIAAIGSSTAEKLEAKGILADFIPKLFSASSIVEEMSNHLTKGDQILILSSNIGGTTLKNGLTNLGAEVEKIVAYKTTKPENIESIVDDVLDQGLDVITFTSPSSVKNLFSVLGKQIDKIDSTIIACIGPVTASALTEIGLSADVVASKHTDIGLVEELKKHFHKVTTSNEQIPSN